MEKAAVEYKAYWTGQEAAGKIAQLTAELNAKK